MFRSTKTLAVFGAAFLLPLLAAMAIPEAVIGGSAVAAEEKKQPKYKDVKTRQRQSVGGKCAKALEKIQVVLEEENWVESINSLNSIESNPKLCASDYEQTQIWKFQGYVYYSLDDFDGSIRSYKKVINGVGTPPELALDTRYTLAQLYTVEEQYAKAAVELEIWMDAAVIIGGDARSLLAQIYYQLDRKTDALNMLELAINDSESKGLLPKEGWWGLQRVLYYEKNDYKRVTSILEKLVTHYPKWTYWKQIGGMYGELEREMDRLVATEIVYLNNQLDKESQVMSMAYMYLGAEVPYRAALIIEKGMKDEIIKKNAKNLEVLGTAWYQSKDLKRALKALESASKVSDTGNLQSRLAGIYLDLGRDKEAYRAAKKAAKKGEVKRPAGNYLVMGNALINLHCYKDAISAFQKSLKVAKDKKSKRYPLQWIRYADVEGTRLQKLRDVGAKVPGCSK
ncbi:tetratricopeptide repeat protein [Porticoccaceae bacterium]|nr:tetratricopeptide repeat protein [Porticoccaceae bacterium]MDB4262703.1 tetratricopeptide repeat protein [Porticoccaceae bacterium]MDB9953795.1 tetratricopeptide repeat protein [Porticoccaceae bacterium]